MTNDNYIEVGTDLDDGSGDRTRVKFSADPTALLEEVESEPGRWLVSDYLKVMQGLRAKNFTYREISAWLQKRGVTIEHTAIYRALNNAAKAEQYVEQYGEPLEGREVELVPPDRDRIDPDSIVSGPPVAAEDAVPAGAPAPVPQAVPPTGTKTGKGRKTRAQPGRKEK